MSSAATPLHVVSVSLGSSTRDYRVSAEFMGREVIVERRGAGSMDGAVAMIAELDGKVDAIGLGGIDLYLIAAGKKFVIRDAQRMAHAATKTPVVDGSGLKHTLERRTVQWLQQQGVYDFRGKRVLLPAGVDRFGVAETLPELGAIPRFGDLIFALGVPIPINRLGTLRVIANLLLPVICRLPFSLIYPTGEKQEETTTRYASHFAWADVIAGDFHYIRRYMPEKMQGKVVITNTITEQDVALLRERGVELLVTSTPNLNGRSFGTNVMEAVVIALLGQRPEEVSTDDYLACLDQLGWAPRIEWLQRGETNG